MRGDQKFVDEIRDGYKVQNNTNLPDHLEKILKNQLITTFTNKNLQVIKEIWKQRIRSKWNWNFIQ